MSLASTILEALKADGTPSHGQISKVVGMCKEDVANEKRDDITGSYWRLMERCEEYQGNASDLSCQLDSLHEYYGLLGHEEEMGAEIVRRMQRASGNASDLSDELENIHEFYKEKVTARLHELDPENYEEEEA
jgi:hypothetical protein